MIDLKWTHKKLINVVLSYGILNHTDTKSFNFRMVYDDNLEILHDSLVRS